MSEPAPSTEPSTKRWGWVAVYGLLFVIAVPWYWPADSTLHWMGMPAWTVVCIGVSVIVSCLTAWHLTRPRRDDDGEGVSR